MGGRIDPRFEGLMKLFLPLGIPRTFLENVFAHAGSFSAQTFHFGFPEMFCSYLKVVVVFD